MTSSSRKLPEISIRPARIEDYDEILAMWRAGGLSARPAGRESPAAFARQLAAFDGLYLVAVDAARIVGVVLGSHDLRKGWINRLAVLPGYRRRGVGAALVRACDAALRAAGIEIVAALVETDNPASCALFESVGYRADVPVRYYRKLSHPQA
ncbi:MAG: GNAT family N-acetyltransferase [Planctomycetes bacterium]|nr:GNAT family N-acetyltransferase [Planctomycetota bacterium]